MHTKDWKNHLSSLVASVKTTININMRRRKLLATAALSAGLAITMSASMTAHAGGGDDGNRGGSKWAASWATSIQSAYIAPTTAQGAGVPAYAPQPDLTIPLPNATTNGVENQTMRMIVKPDLWGSRIRVRFSNVFGTKAVTFSHAAVALQSYQANIVPGTSVSLTFNGNQSVTIQPGQQIFSDPVDLPFVSGDPHSLSGRNLAVSFAVNGSSGPASFHSSAFTTSYISPPNSGDQVTAEDDTAFPYSTVSWFFISEVDVLAPRDTLVVVAFGDSITDGTFSTLNGNDRWANAMSRQLHKQLGNRVSVVDEGIGGNGVVGNITGQPATQRVNRDVISLSGVNLVVWMEGINDLGNQQISTDAIIKGYQQVVAALQQAHIGVIGATLTPSYVPNGQVPANSPLLAAVGATIAGQYGSAQTDGYRKTLNTFILSSGLFNGTADFSAVTTDPNTGTLYAPFVPNSEGSAGDYLHPNRAGYIAMGGTGANAVLSLIHGGH